MKFFLLLPLIVLLIACSGDPDLSTPEQFVDELVTSINEHDTVLLHKLFANEEDLQAYQTNNGTKQLHPIDKSSRKGHLNYLDDKRAESYKELSAISEITSFKIDPYSTKRFRGQVSINHLTVIVKTPQNEEIPIVIGSLRLCKDKWKASGPIYPDKGIIE